MPSIIHFEIHADDIERAARFYRETFGWKIEKWEGPAGAPDYYMVSAKEDGNGIDGGIMKRESPAPQGNEAVRSFVCTVGVNSIDDYMKKIETNGGKLTSPKMPVFDIGWLCYAEDTEKNIFGIMQNDAMVK
ncbi:MAG: VOC family protein [Candidatus Pacebacteria bacterium]|nr:VOC family protein [Candidatus Paceibacterota bacterium]